MGLRRNLVFGVASSAVSALAAIAVVPLYLNYLGQEAYGVIGFYTTWQVLLTVLDLGFSTTLNREVAQAHTPEQRRDATRLAVSLERLYVIVGAAIALLFSVASPWLASRWLNVHDLSVREVAAALTLGGMALGARWPIAIHQAVLLGSRRMVTLSLITIAMTLLSTLVSAALIVWLGMGLRG